MQTSAPSLLLQIFTEKERPQIESLWNSFCKTEEKDTFIVDRFIRHLSQQELIGIEQVEALHFSEPVEMTLSPHLYQQALSSTSPTENDDYIFEKELGKGAMGVVYLAKDKTLGRHIAYKSLLSGSTALPDIAVQRFINEVQITAQLDHPQIIPVYRLAQSDEGLPTYTMKKISGLTLKEMIQKTRSSLDNQEAPAYTREQLLEVFLKVCDALGFAHAKQVIHRDLKPANIMMGPYEDVYVMDWGIARRFGVSEASRELILEDLEQPDMTQAGQILGTPRYMSPQQAAAKNNDLNGQSDLFTMGLILYELLTLQPAIRAKSQIELLKKVLRTDLADFKPYPSATRGTGFNKIEAPLQAIIQKACQRKTDDRYADIKDLATDLRAFLAQETVSVYMPRWWEKAIKTIQYHWKLSFILISSILLLLTLTVVSSLGYQLYSSKQAHDESNAFSQLTSAGASQAQKIEREFLQIQNHLQGLGTRARGALLFGKDNPDAVWYTNQDYINNKAPDFKWSERYQRKISQMNPVVKHAPGLKKSDTKKQLQRLNIINTTFQRIFQASPILIWGYISLENGLHYSYPGKGGYKADYDPRQRPWYKEANKHQTLFWGKPYQDISGLGLVLPAIYPLYKNEREKTEHMGHAGVEMVIEAMIPHYLQLKAFSAIQSVGIIYANGKLLLAANNATGQVKEDLVRPQALNTLLSTSKGNGELRDKNTLWNYFYLEVLDAYYVIQADTSQLIKETKQ